MKKDEILKEIKNNDVMTEIFHDAVFAYMKFMGNEEFMRDEDNLSEWMGINLGLEMALRHLLGFEITDYESDIELHEAIKMQYQLEYCF